MQTFSYVHCDAHKSKLQCESDDSSVSLDCTLQCVKRPLYQSKLYILFCVAKMTRA